MTKTSNRKYQYVRLLPNIDDLMCAGMSSGPVEVQHINNVTDTKVTIRNVTALKAH